eukprot:TRINITY_DN887_c0_g1_i1.p1 TRINITY_DN887_c0_g1~~TRINITY_DN887_c0_g1_i1.p1  ORF type:complete len:176 (+),score=58.93 TRINITY_DN887_c0_g1_i1:42-530(+)
MCIRDSLSIQIPDMQFKHDRTKSEFLIKQTKNIPLEKHLNAGQLQEFDRVNQKIAEEQFEPEIESSENVRRSSLGVISTPVTSIEFQPNRDNDSYLMKDQEMRESDVAGENKKHHFEDKFMLDSLNDQKRLDSASLQHKMPCLLYTSPSPRDQRGSRMPSSA